MSQDSKKRNYAKEYRDYHGTPEQIANRASRNKARSIMEKEVGTKKLKGKDVDHIKPIKSGGTTKRSNLRILSVSKNRGRNN